MQTFVDYFEGIQEKQVLSDNEQDHDSDIDVLEDVTDIFSTNDTDDEDELNTPVSTEGTSVNFEPDSEPLYPESKVTKGVFMLLLALFTSKYNIVGDGIQQLLNLFLLLFYQVIISLAKVCRHLSNIS